MESAFERNLLFVGSLKKVDKTTPTVNFKQKKARKRERTFKCRSSDNKQ